MYTRQSSDHHIIPELNDKYIALPLDRDFTVLDVHNESSQDSAVSPKRETADEETVVWRSILSDLTGLRDLTATLAENVAENKQDLSAIENHARSTAQQTRQTVEELTEAKKSLWISGRNMIIFVLIVFGLCSMFLYSVYLTL